jgi:hypothetical protein
LSRWLVAGAGFDLRRGLVTRFDLVLEGLLLISNPQYVALRWQHMDERQGVSQKSRHNFVFGPAKSDGAGRRVKLTELKLSALAAQREQQEAQRT